MRFALKWPREAQNAPSETWISRRKIKKNTRKWEARKTRVGATCVFLMFPRGFYRLLPKSGTLALEVSSTFFFATPLRRERQKSTKVRKTPAGAPSKKYAPGRRENHTFWKCDSHQWFEHDFGGHENGAKWPPRAKVQTRIQPTKIMVWASILGRKRVHFETPCAKKIQISNEIGPLGDKLTKDTP